MVHLLLNQVCTHFYTGLYLSHKKREWNSLDDFQSKLLPVPNFIQIRSVLSKMKHADEHTGHPHYAFTLRTQSKKQTRSRLLCGKSSRMQAQKWLVGLCRTPQGRSFGGGGGGHRCHFVNIGLPCIKPGPPHCPTSDSWVSFQCNAEHTALPFRVDFPQSPQANAGIKAKPLVTIWQMSLDEVRSKQRQLSFQFSTHYKNLFY
jgi:hypothetical protein